VSFEDAILLGFDAALLSNQISTFCGNRQCSRRSLPVFMLCKLKGMKQVQGIMLQVSRIVSVPFENQEFIYSVFNDAVSS
jgi:hypothetical protein